MAVSYWQCTRCSRGYRFAEIVDEDGKWTCPGCNQTTAGWRKIPSTDELLGVAEMHPPHKERCICCGRTGDLQDVDTKWDTVPACPAHIEIASEWHRRFLSDWRYKDGRSRG